jgi:hypothetical protein
MLVRINNVWLTADFGGGEVPRSSAVDPRFNGRRVVQLGAAVNAARQLVVNRGNAVASLSFAVEEAHPDLANAGAAVGRAFDAAPAEGEVDIYMGDPVSGWIQLRMADAVLEAVADTQLTGVSTRITYQITAPGVDYVATLPGTGGSPEYAGGIDGGGYTAIYGPPEAGTVDGGNYADGLIPISLNIDCEDY